MCFFYAKVRNAKVAHRAAFRDAALKQATTADFKARLEIGSRGEFYGALARRFALLT
jgi:hypothetical protein